MVATVDSTLAFSFIREQTAALQIHGSLHCRRKHSVMCNYSNLVIALLKVHFNTQAPPAGMSTK